jgi:sensor c-di-GMP phosphodiesterase-like protein
VTISTGYHAGNQKQLKDIGVRFLIDDFGTGYSALSYLETLPADGKLDKSFLFAMEESENAKIIVENIIGLGKSLFAGCHR